MLNAVRQTLRSTLLILTCCLISLGPGLYGSKAGSFSVPQEPVVVTIALCPSLRQYTLQQEARLKVDLAQLRQANPSSPILTMIVDYRALREACRAINGTKK